MGLGLWCILGIPLIVFTLVYVGNQTNEEVTHTTNPPAAIRAAGFLLGRSALHFGSFDHQTTASLAAASNPAAAGK